MNVARPDFVVDAVQASPCVFPEMALCPARTRSSMTPALQLFSLALSQPSMIASTASRLGVLREQKVDGVNQEVRSSDIHLDRLDGDECRCLVGQG